MAYLIGVMGIPPYYGLFIVSAGLLLSTIAGDRIDKRQELQKRRATYRVNQACAVQHYASQDLLPLSWPETWPRELWQVMGTLQARPALQAAGHHRRTATNGDCMYYAFLCCARTGNEEMLVVLNFQNDPRQVRVVLNGPATLQEVLTGKRLSVDDEFVTTLPAYGYAFYQIER